MPTLIAAKEVKLEFADLERRVALIGRPAIPPARRPGIHVSGVLGYVAQQIGILKPGEKEEEDFPLLWALGQAWEEYIFSFYPEMDWQPGEVTVDEVSMNCDGLSVDSEYELDGVPWDKGGPQLVLEEAKFTFKGETDGDTFLKDNKFWMWRQQVASYCHGYSARVTRHHVCHVRGDYKSFGPTYRQYILRWSDKEIRQSWNLILNNKHKAVAEEART